MHTTGGYLTQVAFTHRAVFDLHPERDVYWCAADIGWVTGHSYIVYGPLANGATSVMYEGTPDFPDRDRWWSIIERYGVTILYCAPTAIRTFMKWGTEFPGRHDLSSLRVLGSVGEPINPEAWMWYSTAHRRRALPGGRHLVADRDGGHHDRAAARPDHHQAGLGHLPPAGHRRRGGGRGGPPGGPGRRLPHPHPPVAVDAARHLRRPRALPGHLLEPLRGPLLRRRRGQDRRRRLPLAAGPGGRRDERLGPPHLDHRGGVGPGRPPERGRVGRGRGERRHHRPGHRGLRDPAGRRRAGRRREGPGAPPARGRARSGRSPGPRRSSSPTSSRRPGAGRSCAACCATWPRAAVLGDTTTLADPAVVDEIRRLAATSPTDE